MFQVQDDTCPSFDDARGNSETNDGAGWEIVPLVLTSDDFTIGGDDTWRRQLFVDFVLVFSPVDDLVIQFIGAYDFVKLLKRQIVDVFLFVNDFGLYQPLGFAE